MLQEHEVEVWLSERYSKLDPYDLEPVISLRYTDTSRGTLASWRPDDAMQLVTDILRGLHKLEDEGRWEPKDA